MFFFNHQWLLPMPRNSKYWKTSCILFALFFVFLEFAGYAQNLPSGFSHIKVAGDIGNPSVMAVAPDGRIFVAEQGGKMFVIKNGKKLSKPFMQLNVASSGERGLIGIALDPNFSANHYLYIYYTIPGAAYNRISRFTANGDVVLAGSEKIVLNLDRLSNAHNHNGGALHFGKDGKLYIATGENADPDLSQNLNTYHGKLLRINPDGSVPNGNPFTSGSEQRKRIWAYGLRNPYTFSIQPGTGKVFVNDVGQESWEEVNDATNGGKNFGWPQAEGRSNNRSYANPVFTYQRRSGDGTDRGCAITGGTFYNPATASFPSSYVGKYFYMDYCNGWISVFDPNNPSSKSVFATNLSHSIINLSVGTDGSLYYLSRGHKALYKIMYTGSKAPVITSHPANVNVSEGQSATFQVSASGSNPLHFQWQKNGTNINGATQASFTIENTRTADAGKYRVVVKNAAGSITSNEATLTIDSFDASPVASISTPTAGSSYRAGETIRFSGTATDKEDGTLPASAFSWSVVFHHDDHTHDGPPIANGVKNGSFDIPNSGETATNVWYRLYLTVTDSKGLKHTVSRDVHPRTARMSFATDPAGLNLMLDGKNIHTPYAVESVQGLLRNISAPASLVKNGEEYRFNGWSHGGDREQRIATPNNNITYTARYEKVEQSTYRNADNPSNTIKGLEYTYHEGVWDQLPDFASLATVKSGAVNNFDLSPRKRNSDFGFRFSGYIEVPADGKYTFYTASDDGSMLYIGSTLVVNNDGLQRYEEQSGSIALKRGKHAITVTYFERQGQEILDVSYAGPGISKRAIPAAALYSEFNPRNADNPSNTIKGLEYTYHEGVWDQLPNFASLATVKSGAVNNFDLSPRKRNSDFGFRFSGYIEVPADGKYTFYTASDDGSMLYIGSTLVVNNDGLQWYEEQSGSIALKRGKHAITVTYFERQGQEILDVSYAGPGISKRAIPAAVLYRKRPHGRIAADVEPAANNLSIFPNPADEKLTINFEADKEQDVGIQLTDMLSRTVYSKMYKAVSGNNVIEINVSALRNGTYLVIINQGNKQTVRRITVAK